MKLIFAAVLALAVGVHSMPPAELEGNELELDGGQQRLVTNQIRSMIDDLSRNIRNAGLDPMEVRRLVIENELESGTEMRLGLTDVFSDGLSSITIHRLEYNLITNRLRLELSLPQVRFSAGNVDLQLNSAGTKTVARLGGDFSFNSLRINTDIRVNVGIISGISIRSVDANLRLQNIRSNLNVLFQGEDQSQFVNNFINVGIPQYLRENQAQVDRRLSEFIRDVANQLLN